MEMPSTSQSERSQFRTAVEENLEDVVSRELMTRAVTLFPCGHNLNEDTVIQCIARNNLCPFDRKQIERYTPNYTIRHLAETAHTHPEEYHEEPPTDEAKKHFDRGKACFESGEYEEGIAALLAALQLSPTYAKAQGYLDACLNQVSHRNEASSPVYPESSNNPRERSIEIALNILEHPEVKQDASLYSILVKYIEGLLSEESAELLSEEKTIAVWVQKLVGEDKKVRVFFANVLKRMHGEPSTSANIIPSTSTPSTSAASSSRSQIPSIAFFGKGKWEKYFGDVGVEPPLPSNIDGILNSPCPFWPNKKVKDTHLLTLIPSTIDGHPFTLNLLEKLIGRPKAGHATKYRYYISHVKRELGDKGAPSSYWVLMTKDVIPNSRTKRHQDQKKLIAAKAKKSGIPYALPKALEAATVILMHFVETGEALYNNLSTFTRCEEKVLKNRWPAAIGGFSSGGLCVFHFYYRCAYGVAGLRKF